MNCFLLTILVAFSFGLEADRYESKDEANVNYDDGIHYEGLVSMVQKNKIQSIDETIALLPQDFLRHYVLMYRSRSLQDASPLFPRAIVFGRSSKFILAFNGHEKQKGFNNLEIIQFREKENRWEFREITFFKDKPPVFSEANPKKCLECHQSPLRQNVDPRPNWEPYNFWPGAYASVDGTVKPTLKPNYEAYLKDGMSLSGVLSRFLPQDQFLLDEQASEEDNLEKFLNSVKPQHPRYKYLSNFSVRKPLSLTKLTVILNLRRVVRIIREELGELFDIYKYAVIGLADYASMSSSEHLKSACGNLYLPPQVRDLFINKTLQVRTLREEEYISPPQAVRWKHGFAAGLEILFTPLGVQTDDWSMDFRTEGRFGFQDRFTSPHDTPTHFLDAIQTVYQGDPALELDCRQLKEASEKSFSAFAESGRLQALLNTKNLERKIEPRPLIQRCISCHVEYQDGGQAPWIPFDDFNRLRPLLKEEKYKHGTLFDEILFRTSDHAPLREQMPPAGLTDRHQRDEFIDKLRKLLE